MVDSIKDILNDENKLNEITKTSFDIVDIDKSGTIDERCT